jgi:rare lipoprotein A
VHLRKLAFVAAAFALCGFNLPPAPAAPAAPDSASSLAAVPEAPMATAKPAEASLLGTGAASYYGARFAGRPTASGEIFDPAQLTAAHRKLPMGSVVRVTDKATGKSVVVRINDRGPYVGDRIIDISRAAAAKLGMLDKGVAEVTLELLSRT